jgi:heme-degrading monooxygenase HmoA
MIARVWKGYATPENAPLYLEHLQHNVFPELEQIDGYRGANVLQKEANGEVEFIVITYWQSMDAIRQFAGENTEIAVVAAEAQAVLSHYESTVLHYEMPLHK